MKHSFESFVPVGGLALTLFPQGHLLEGAVLWVEMPVQIGGQKFETGYHREFRMPLPAGEIDVLPVEGNRSVTLPKKNPDDPNEAEVVKTEKVPSRGGWIRLTGVLSAIPAAAPSKPPAPVEAPAEQPEEGSAPRNDPPPSPVKKKK